MINNTVDTLIINSIINESVAGDVATSPAFIGELLRQTFATSILPQITSVMPLTKPEGYIYTLQSYYQQENVHFDSVVYITLNTANAYVQDTEVSWNTGTGKIIYVEDSQYLLELITGTKPVNTTTITDGTTSTTVTEVLKPTTFIKKIFANYSKPNTTSSAEYDNNINELGHTLKRQSIVAKTRKIKTTITKEVIQDFQAQFGESAQDIILEILQREITEEIENEIFNYMDSIALDTAPLMLTDLSGTNTLSLVYSDITTRIFKEIAQISKRTGRNLDCFIITSSEVIAALAASGALTWAKSGSMGEQSAKINSNYIGVAMGVLDVFQNDFPSNGNEVIVGYKSKVNNMGDAGIIYTPYMVMPYYSIDPETAQETLYVMVRYNFTRNLLDSGTATGDSDYFTKFNVDFTNVTRY